MEYDRHQKQDIEQPVPIRGVKCVQNIRGKNKQSQMILGDKKTWEMPNSYNKVFQAEQPQENYKNDYVKVTQSRGMEVLLRKHNNRIAF